MVGKKAQTSGSPPTGEPAFLAVGKLRRAHGVRGEMVVELFTDFPERLQPKKKVFIGDNYMPMTLCSVRNHNEGLLLGFNGVDTPEDAGRYRNQIMYISAHSVPPLESGEYYHHQLLGLSVVDEHNTPLGVLTEIIETGANDVYVISRSDGGEILIPAIPDVILNVDLEANTIHVHLLPGLVDGDE